MTRHLVTVWNPSYARDAMDEHLRVLRDCGSRFTEGTANDDDVYVWWGKVKSSNRQQPMAHRADALAVGDQLVDDEVQLYLTDYRALYVGDVLEVRGDELPASEHAHVPSYYREADLRCDLWFKLADIRRLVVDDTLGVVEELKKLRNVHYNDRPVSIYGGMVDLPLVVTRPDGARFFDPDERDTLTGDRLWAEFDAEQGSGISTVERDLRDNRFGDTLWYALEPAARVFLATGERLYRDHRADAAFDFSPALTSLAKAVEVPRERALVLRQLPRRARRARRCPQSSRAFRNDRPRYSHALAQPARGSRLRGGVRGPRADAGQITWRPECESSNGEHGLRSVLRTGLRRRSVRVRYDTQGAVDRRIARG